MESSDIHPNTISIKTASKPSLPPPPNVSQISIQEFLLILRTAYQVQDNVDSALIAKGMTKAANWLKLKENRAKHGSAQTVESKTSLEPEDRKKNVDCIDPLKEKLNEVLDEGLLDSVLPYLVQNGQAPLPRRSSVNIKLNPEKQSSNESKHKEEESQPQKTDSEVEIHVCDEVRGAKKTFVCNQKLLLEKMGYFNSITAGQRLEDMDISVHCDISIFEWLMRWVKKESLLEEDWPELDLECVVPILVSASFLQMEPLLQDCLLFMHQRLNDILRTNVNLSCLNDSIITRLAAMYTNQELETIRDKKDKIQSRLFVKLILSLMEPEAESVRGHWCSFARVFRCEKCQQLINPSVSQHIPCVPSSMRLQWDGTIISLHNQDPSWDINEYLVKLHKILKSWRRVYWRLWGNCHHLFCLTCKRYFPSNQVGWCRFHPDPPQFFTLDAQKAPLPVGRYPCCGERAYRFQLLPNYSGCQFRQHSVCTKDVKHSAIYAMLESFRHLIEEEPPQLMFPERLTRLVARDPSSNEKGLVCKENFWWEGFEIIPPRPKLGMLSKFAKRADTPNSSSNAPLANSPVSEESSEDISEEASSNSSSDNVGSDESNPTPKRVVKCKQPVKRTTKLRRKRKKKLVEKVWQTNLSARTNQDTQRAFEENAIKDMNLILNKKAGPLVDHNKAKFSRNVTPAGGVWVRLENDWRENLNINGQTKLKNIFTGKIKTRLNKSFNH